ncbi:hypothetical protein KEM52_002799, partial [Ascosphaera acerosa]
DEGGESQRRAGHPHLRHDRRAALRRLPQRLQRGEPPARQDGLQHRHAADRGLPRARRPGAGPLPRPARDRGRHRQGRLQDVPQRRPRRRQLEPRRQAVLAHPRGEPARRVRRAARRRPRAERAVVLQYPLRRAQGGAGDGRMASTETV